MKLSELVYLCVKNAIAYDDSSFTYDNFIRGKFDGDPDYSNSINNVFSPLNQAITELGDLERIPYVIDKIHLEHSNSFSVLDLSKNLKEIVAIGYFDFDKFVPCGWWKVANTIYINAKFIDKDIFVEYKEKIPQFGFGEYKYEYSFANIGGIYQLEPTTSKDFEMEDYGINNDMCNKIVQYVKAVLTEQVAPELSNMHFTRAMQFFADIDPVRSELRQQNVVTEFKIW